MPTRYASITKHCQPKVLDAELCANIRASILLAGPLLARFGKVVLPPPGGGCHWAAPDRHPFPALEQLGAQVTVGDRYELEASELTGADIFLDEPRRHGNRERNHGGCGRQRPDGATQRRCRAPRAGPRPHAGGHGGPTSRGSARMPISLKGAGRSPDAPTPLDRIISR